MRKRSFTRKRKSPYARTNCTLDAGPGPYDIHRPANRMIHKRNNALQWLFTPLTTLCTQDFEIEMEMQQKHTSSRLSFTGLPTEIQLCIASQLADASDIKTLQALAACSRHCRELSVRHFFERVAFTPISSGEAVQNYLTHYAARYGRYCRDLQLAFRLGPTIAEEIEKQRAALFARITEACAPYIQTLFLNSAGANLGDTAETLLAVSSVTFPQLETLRLQLFDVEHQDTETVISFFNGMAQGAVQRPRLREIIVEGYIELLASEVYTQQAPCQLFGGLTSFLTNTPQLSKLSLARLSISSLDLRTLLDSAPQLTELALVELDGKTLEDCIMSIMESSAREQLTALEVRLSYGLIPSSSLRLPPTKARIVFPSLKKLSLAMMRYYTASETSDLGIFCLYTSLFRCPKLHFPALGRIHVHDAFAYSNQTSKIIAAHLCRSKKASFPQLRHLVCSPETPESNYTDLVSAFLICDIALLREKRGAREELSLFK